MPMTQEYHFQEHRREMAKNADLDFTAAPKLFKEELLHKI